MSKISLCGIGKRFGSQEVLRSIDLEIDDGEFVVIVGPSGSGKTTLLRLIVGLEEADEGTIRIDDQIVNRVPPNERELAMVFQNYTLYPHMSVSDNLTFGLRMAGVSKSDCAQKLQATAATLQIEHLLDRKPAELSGGERQRVAIGRAIIRKPKAFLFDEPLSNLDATLRAEMRVELAALKKSMHGPVVYVTHDQEEAMTLADRIVVLNEGVVQQVGKPSEVYQNPANRFVAQFIGAPRMNLIDASVTGVSEDAVDLEIDDGTSINLPREKSSLSVGQKVSVGIRPEHLRLLEKGPLSGDVVAVENLGARSNVWLRFGRSCEVVSISDSHDFQIGSVVNFQIDTAKCQLFNGNGERQIA